MFDSINPHHTVLTRHYQSLNNDTARVTLGDLNVIVEDHPFWPVFAKGWEPNTLKIYQQFLSPGSTVLDIGAWIGPTLLFSLACGATNIIALEPNPNSFNTLQTMLGLNPKIANKVSLHHKAISNVPGLLNMGLADGESDTSTFGITGDEIQVKSTTISQIVNENQLGKIDLIKIDIEGAESLLTNDLKQLANRENQAIHLSIHVPFFPESIDRLEFAASFREFTVFDDRGEKLNQEILTKRLTTDASHPRWGTKHGNFFELLLLSQ